MEIAIAVFLGLWQAVAAWLAWRRLRADYGQDTQKDKKEAEER